MQGNRDREVLLVSFNCSIIDENLAMALNNRGFNVKYVGIDEEKFSRYGMHKKFSVVQGLYSKFINNLSRLIICSEINDFLLLSLLSLIMLKKPRRLVIVLPPGSRERTGKLPGLKISLMRLLLSFLNETLIVYTTPMERIYTGGLLDSHDYTYFPVSANEPVLMRSLIYSEKPLFITTYNDYEKEFYVNTIRILEQLEVYPRFVFLLVDDSTKCLQDPRVICIRTDSYDSVIDYASVVILKENTPHTNELLVKSIMHGRPVLASSEIGLLRLFMDTDLIVLENNWKPDNISLILLRILNEIDRFKKASLSKIPSGIDNSRGVEKIVRFLE